MNFLISIELGVREIERVKMKETKTERTANRLVANES